MPDPNSLTARDRLRLSLMWKRSSGRAWEPPGGTGLPELRRYVSLGFLKVEDGICGFERIKDAMMVWTAAGRLAMTTIAPELFI